MTFSLAGSPAPQRVSVVLCTYNGSAFVGQQFDSLLAQSRRPDEIVIADDASVDSTPAEIEQFAVRCRALGIDVIVRLRPENVGFIDNFADALRLASGDVIFLCDQDDIWYPGKLATITKALLEDPELSLLFTDARLVDADGGDLGQTLFAALELPAADWHAIAAGNAFPVLLKRAVVTGATCAFRRSLLDRALPIPPGWIHDEWLATVAALFGRIAAIDVPQIDYRQHGGNQIGVRKRTVRMRVADLFTPRNALLEKAVQRMTGLQQRFGDDPYAPVASRQLLADRLAHFAQRMAIGRRPHLARPPLALAEWKSGRYSAHGNGASSLLRDLLRKD